MSIYPQVQALLPRLPGLRAQHQQAREDAPKPESSSRERASPSHAAPDLQARWRNSRRTSPTYGPQVLRSASGASGRASRRLAGRVASRLGCEGSSRAGLEGLGGRRGGRDASQAKLRMPALAGSNAAGEAEREGLALARCEPGVGPARRRRGTRGAEPRGTGADRAPNGGALNEGRSEGSPP